MSNDTEPARTSPVDRQIESDIRSVRRSTWLFVTLGLIAVALLVSLIFLFLKPRPAAVKTMVEFPAPKSVRVVDVTWLVDEKGADVIAGQIVNDSPDPIHNVTVGVLFFDDAHALVTTKSVVVDLPTPLASGARHPFTITGPHDPKYKAADYRVESWR